jgi:O-antigen ligase
MQKRILTDLPLLLFCLFTFILLPTVFFTSTIDADVAPRFLLISLFGMAYALYFLFFLKKKNIQIGNKEKKGIILLTCLIIWMLIRMYSSINPGVALLECTRIAVLYCFLLITYFVFLSSYKDFLLAVPKLRQDQTSIHFDRTIVFLTRFASGAVIIYSSYGFYQLFKVLPDFLDNKPIHINEILTSSLANKNFFSEVLVLLLPFQVYGVIKEKKVWKILFIFSLSLEVFFIIILRSAASWMAIATGLVAFSIITFRQKQWRFSTISFRKRAIIFISTVAIFLFFTFSPLHKKIISNIHLVGEYITQSDSLIDPKLENNNSFFERFILWRNSIKMIRDHPVFGVGIENWRIYNPMYGISGTQYINSGMIYYEHPHNDYLLILTEQGPIGLIIYLSIFFFVLSGIRKLNLDVSRSLLTNLFASGIFSFMMLSMFAYPRSRIYSMIILMIYFAWIFLMKSENFERKNLIPKKVYVVILLVCVLGFYYALLRLKGEIHTRKMYVAQVNKNYVKLIREADLASSWIYPMDLTTTPLSWYKGMAYFYSGEVKAAIEQYEEAMIINPNHLRILNDLGSSYQHAGLNEQAISCYKRAMNISPLSIDLNLNLSAVYFNLRNADSSFYFIDKIYNKPLSWSEEQTYNKFLDVILYAKAYSSLIQYPDTILPAKTDSIISDSKFLKQLYMRSKDENQSFTKILKKNLTH